MDEARERETAALLFEIHSDNEPIVLLFLALQTQWRIAVGMGGAAYLGLDYGVVPAVMGLTGVRERAEVFAGLRVMEAAALPILNAPKGDSDV